MQITDFNHNYVIHIATVIVICNWLEVIMLHVAM